MNSQQNRHTQLAATTHTAKTAAATTPDHVWHMRKAEVPTTVGWPAMPQWGIQAAPEKQVVAFSMLVPTDWTFASNTGAPHANDCVFTIGRIGFNAMNPEKTAGLIERPATVSLWSNDRSVLMQVQQDNQRFGPMQTCKLVQPQPLAQAIAGRLVDFDPKLQVAGPMEPVPGVAEKLHPAVERANQQLAQQGSQLTAEVGRVPIRIGEGTTGGQAYLTVMQTVRTDHMPNGSTLWTIDYPLQVISFAPEGKYAAMEPMFTAMLDSVWVNPEYQQNCTEVSANVQSIKQQTKARVSQIESQMALDNLNAARQQAAIRQGVQDYASHVYSSVAANRSAALEHSSQQFSMYMGDQALYHDPTTGGTVQLPSGANHAWASQTGNTNEYILTDSSSFNPNGNVGSGHWTQMNEVR